MKKVIAICFLIAILITGGMTTEAKSTKKKAKSKSSHSYRKSDDTTFTKKYKGNIGPYEVIVTLTFYDYDFDSMVRSNNWKVKGSYVYTEARNKLNLKGDFITLAGPYMQLEEYTPKGRKSATWSLEGDEDEWFDYFEGDFENLSNGKEYKVYLRAVN